VNIQKSNRIPDLQILSEKAVKERIIGYWEILFREFNSQFQSEIQVSLLGNKAFSKQNWQMESYEQLKRLCQHLINDRGFEPYTHVR
jgi:hypothetical protein